jgi:Peptidase inhibitor family I36
MKLRNKVLVLIAATIASVAMWAAPAHAAWECTNPSFCVWDYGDGTGPRYYWTETSTPPISGCVNIGGAWNDRVGSAYNRSSNKAIFLYPDANCYPLAGRLTILPGQRKYGADLGVLLDRASSFYYVWCTHTTVC